MYQYIYSDSGLTRHQASKNCKGNLCLDPANVTALQCPDCGLAVAKSRMRIHRGSKKCIQRSGRLQAQLSQLETASKSMRSLRISESDPDTSHGSIRFPCDVCSQTFVNTQGLGSHKSMFHSKPTVAAASVAASVPIGFTCSICKMTCTSKAGLGLHMLKNHD
jgi:hypothetical protein